MKRFEHQITSYPAAGYRRLVFVCSNSGECTPDLVPGDELRILTEQLDLQGKQGWELVQLAFSGAGILAFWKRERKD